MDPLAAAVARLRALADSLPPMEGAVQLTREGAFCTLLIDNPKSANALTIQMMASLGEHVLALRELSSSVLFVRSVPGPFCAGAHLGQVRAHLLDNRRALLMSESMTVILDALASLNMLVIVYVQGAARGGGAELMTACDLCWWSPNASAAFVHTKLGVVPGWGATSRLVRMVGYGQAAGLLTSGDVIEPSQAMVLGLAHQVVDEDEWTALSTRLISRSPRALVALKQQLLGGDSAQAFASVWGSPSHRRALGLAKD